MLDAQLAWRAVLTLLVVVPWIATMALALIDQAEWEHYQDMKFRVRATGRWTNPRA